MNDGASRTILTMLLLCVAALVYLDWRRTGEIENLHARLDKLAPPSPLRAPPTPQTPAAPVHAPEPVFVGDGEVLPGSVPVDETATTEPSMGPHPLVQAVLRAHTDPELDTIARDQ